MRIEKSMITPSVICLALLVNFLLGIVVGYAIRGIGQ